jgi:hypothetical protein
MACHFMSLFGFLNFFEIMGFFLGFLSDFSVLSRFFYGLSRLILACQSHQRSLSSFLLDLSTIFQDLSHFSGPFNHFSGPFNFFVFRQVSRSNTCNKKNKGLHQNLAKTFASTFMITIKNHSLSFCS